MQCPLCKTEMRIQSNKVVQKKDGTFAYKMVLSCRDKKCNNFGKPVTSSYVPIEVEDDDEEE